MNIKSRFLALLVIGLFVGGVQANQSDVTKQAREIIAVAGVQGGMVVHLGCGDGKLTAALRVNDLA